MSKLNDFTFVICLKCNSRVNEFPNRKRTICPYCGNLFELNENKYVKEIEKNSQSLVKSSTKPVNKINRKINNKSRFSWFHNDCKSNEVLIDDSKNPFLLSNETYLINWENGNINKFKGKNIVLEFDKEIVLEYLNWFILKKQIDKDFQGICEAFQNLFSTFQNIYFHFRMEHSSLEIHLDKLYKIYDCLNEMSMEFQTDFMMTIKRTIQSSKNLKYVNENVFALIVILLNPLFDNEEFFAIFELCIDSVLSVHIRKDQQIIIDILIRLPITKFRILLQNAQNYLSCCLYSKNSLLLSNVKLLNRCIENAVKYISLLNAANDFKSSYEKLPITAFYNYLIDLENLIRDYKIWENPYLNEFTFCQYPCVLSILAKKQILQKESEEQMMITAKNNLFIKVQQRQTPEFEMLFLNLSIRRCNILSDSMNQILIKRKELKKKLKVEFIGEPGLDMGGLTKEWFLLLLRQIMKAEKSVFSYDAKSQCNWFHSIPPGNKHREFYLTGILMGLAVYNSVNLDVEFPLFCYKKLLSRKVYTPRNKQAGYCLATLDDLATIYPDLARGLKELILYEGDIENDFYVTFEIFYEDWNGKICNHLLKENGSNIYVTLENRAEYVELYCDFLLNSLIATEFLDFYNGFHTVCDSNILMLLQPEEIKSLVCGNPIINLSGLKNVVLYDNYKATDKTIVIFWEILLDFNESRQKLFLHFTTGSSKVPIGGIQELQFKISKSNNKNMLPMAYTCFNQLILPEYNDKNILKQKLLIAIENSEGFGLT